MDEKLLEEIRRQEAVGNADEEEEDGESESEEVAEALADPEVPPPTGQQTLFGGGE